MHIINFLSQGFRKLSLDRQTDRHTDTQTDRQPRPTLCTTLLGRRLFIMSYQFYLPAPICSH